MDPEEKSSQAVTATLPFTSASQYQGPQRLPPVPGSGPESVFPQSTGSTPINFFNLPSKARNNIYKRVLIVAHPLYLFQDAGSRVETFAPDKPLRWNALLYTNRQMNSEASAVLYGMNNFALLDGTRQDVGLVEAFLNCIGPMNSSLLSHLSIDFPVMEGQSGNSKLREDSLESLKFLQEKCTNLATLETHLHNNKFTGWVRANQDNPQIIRDALSQYDVQLKAIPSLDKIIVRVYGGIPTPSVMDVMQGFGWVVLPGHRNQW